MWAISSDTHKLQYMDSLCRCCFVPIIINSVSFEFSLSLFDFIHNEMRMHIMMTDVVSSRPNDLTY